MVWIGLVWFGLVWFGLVSNEAYLIDIGSVDHFDNFWIQKSHHLYDFWIQKSLHFYDFWIQKYNLSIFLFVSSVVRALAMTAGDPGSIPGHATNFSNFSN